ncbi:MAG: hypothetical protein DMF77_13135 [Acidobacteria bacterium]|nr:MAG: hypothetical protein DMF77_13135 [Acidobacteriota bacterium]
MIPASPRRRIRQRGTHEDKDGGRGGVGLRGDVGLRGPRFGWPFRRRSFLRRPFRRRPFPRRSRLSRRFLRRPGLRGPFLTGLRLRVAPNQSPVHTGLLLGTALHQWSRRVRVLRGWARRSSRLRRIRAALGRLVGYGRGYYSRYPYGYGYYPYGWGGLDLAFYLGGYPYFGGYDAPYDIGYVSDEPYWSGGSARDEDYYDRDDPRDDARAEGAALRLIVVPDDASVWIDGAFRGVARGLVRLAPGRHEVEVVRPGFRTATREIAVHPGTTASLRIELERP